MIMLFLGIGIVSMQYTFADTEFCSTTQRGSQSHTYNSLFNNPSQAIKDKFTFQKRSEQINGNILWYNNFSNCSGGPATSPEKAAWDSFWSKHSAKVSGVNTTSNISTSDAKKLQQYISSTCGLSLEDDGEIGIKTLNAAMICNTLKESGTSNLPIDGTQNGSTTNGGTQNSTVCEQKFTTLFEQVKSNVKVESNQCCYINTSSSSSNSSWQLSTDKKQATYSSISIPVCTTSSAGDGTANGGQQGNGANNSNGGGTPNASTASCFALPKDAPAGSSANLTDGFVYDSSAQDTATCSCKNGTKKVSKILYDGGKATAYSINVCQKCDPKKCNCGIKLNTNIPFIGRCIMYGNTNNTGLSGDVTTVNSVSAFPILMGAIIRILVSAILLVCFGTLIVGGFMMTVPDQYKTGKGLVMKVVYTIAALGSLGIILYLVNPNFFK